MLQFLFTSQTTGQRGISKQSRSGSAITLTRLCIVHHMFPYDMYGRTSIARIPMARLPWLIRTRC